MQLRQHQIEQRKEKYIEKNHSIDNMNSGTKKYNTNADYSYLFGGTQNVSTGSTFNLNDYASIKNGSYKKLLKAYYAKQE